MELSNREMWGLIHGLVLGSFFLLDFSSRQGRCRLLASRGRSSCRRGAAARVRAREAIELFEEPPFAATPLDLTGFYGVVAATTGELCESLAAALRGDCREVAPAGLLRAKAALFSPRIIDCHHLRPVMHGEGGRREVLRKPHCGGVFPRNASGCIRRCEPQSLKRRCRTCREVESHWRTDTRWSQVAAPVRCVRSSR